MTVVEPQLEERIATLERRVDLALDHLVALSTTMVARFESLERKMDARFDEVLEILRER